MDKQKFIEETATDLSYLKEYEDRVVTSDIKDGKYVLGVAEDQVRGYTPLHIEIPAIRIDEVREIVSGINKILFPDKKELDVYKIVLSTMRK